jgi:hypothetical protein
MIGKKLYKNNKNDMAQYTATAQWCNANNAHIEDKGLYYEVCENVIPEPTVDEKLAALNAQYDADKATLVSEYTDAIMHDDEETAEAIKQEMAELDAQYDADYEAIINEETEEE